MRVPAGNAEADAWTARGWADVAVGCLALDGPEHAGSGAFSGLDEMIRSIRVVSGGQHAARLRRVRRLAGPVPPWYPDTRPVAGPVRAVREIAWRASALVGEFGGRLRATAAGLPHEAALPLVSARQLAWGLRYRPSPSQDHVTLRLPVSRRLARRTWMCLPGLGGPGTVIAEVSSTATAIKQQIWRGIHEGAHLDHLSAMAAVRRAHGAAPPDPGAPSPGAPDPGAPSPGAPDPGAPSPGEFGAGLLVAESYAMAVEMLAAVECVLAGEGHAVRQLGAGLIERATRLPGASNPAAEFEDLPTLAEVYVLGPLRLLSGGLASAVLPAELTSSLLARWQAACAAYPPAAAVAARAADLIGRPDPGGLG